MYTKQEREMPSACDKFEDAGYRERAAVYELESENSLDHNFLAQMVAPDVHTVLEIPAGVGRNLPVWRQFPDVNITMVDLEQAMVAKIRQKIRADEGLSHITAVRGDMKTLNMGTQFDLIVVPQEAFQLVATRWTATKVLEVLNANLSKDGRIVLDLARFDPSWDGPWATYYHPHERDGDEIAEWSLPMSQDTVLSRTRTQYHRDHAVHFDLKYYLKEGNRLLRQWRALMTLNDFAADEVVEWIQIAGLSVNATFSDYDGTPYNGRSARQLFILRKQSPTPSYLYAD